VPSRYQGAGRTKGSVHCPQQKRGGPSTPMVKNGNPFRARDKKVEQKGISEGRKRRGKKTPT